MDREFKYTVNVKVQKLDIADATRELLGEQEIENVYTDWQETFWSDAAEIARDHGFADVLCEGRSGGWCAPVYHGGSGRGRCTISRWLQDCYEHEEAEHAERFAYFEIDLCTLLVDAIADFEADLAERADEEQARRDEIIEQCKGTTE